MALCGYVDGHEFEGRKRKNARIDKTFIEEGCAVNSIHISEIENTVTISIRNRFDFAMHREFRSTYVDRSDSSKYVVNMRDVTYMDSSALGMLLRLREHAINNGGEVFIANCNPDIKKLLAIANFGRLFEIQ